MILLSEISQSYKDRFSMSAPMLGQKVACPKLLSHVLINTMTKSNLVRKGFIAS